MLARLGLTPYAFRATTAYYWSFTALGLSQIALGPALPFLADQMQVALAQASLLVTARAAGFLVGSFLAGRLADRGRPHGMLQACAAAAAVLTLALPHVPLFWWLAGLLIAVGLLEGTLDIGFNVLIVWLFRNRVAPYMTGLHFVWGIGALLAPLVIVFFHDLTGDLVVSYAVIALALLSISLAYIRLPSPEPVRPRHEARYPLSPWPMFLLSAMLFMAAALQLSVSTWLLAYILELDLTDEVTGGLINSGFFLGIIATRLASVPLLQRMSIARLLAVSLLFVTLGCLAVLAFPQSLPVLRAAVIVIGAGFANLFPGALNLAPRYLPAEGRVTSYMYIGSGAAFFVTPWITGQLFDHMGPNVIWSFALGGTAVLMLLLVLLVRVPRYRGPGATGA